MTCQRIGRYPICTMGLGMSSASRMRNPSPPQKRTTFIPSYSFQARSFKVCPASASVHFHFRDRHDKASIPFSHVGVLLDDLLFQIPRENQHVVRVRLANVLRRIDGNVRAWEELAVFVRVPVHSVFQKVSADAAVVEQRVALAGSAVARHSLPFAPGADEE